MGLNSKYCNYPSFHQNLAGLALFDILEAPMVFFWRPPPPHEGPPTNFAKLSRRHIFAIHSCSYFTVDRV